MNRNDSGPINISRSRTTARLLQSAGSGSFSGPEMKGFRVSIDFGGQSGPIVEKMYEPLRAPIHVRGLCPRAPVGSKWLKTEIV
jgi:hypothetical protein